MMCACFLLVCYVILMLYNLPYFYLFCSLSLTLNSYLVFWKAYCLFIFHFYLTISFVFQLTCSTRNDCKRSFRVSNHIGLKKKIRHSYESTHLTSHFQPDARTTLSMMQNRKKEHNGRISHPVTSQ